MSRIPALLFLLLIAAACGHQPAQPPVAETKTTAYRVKGAGCIITDTAQLVQLRCGLYKNSKGAILFGSKAFSETGTGFHDVYVATVYNGDSVEELRHVIDTGTIRLLGTFYWKDRHHVYCFTPMSDGGTVRILPQARPQYFHVLEGDSDYGADDRYGYFRGTIVPGADPHTLRSFNGPSMACDKRYFYSLGNRMTRQEVKQQGLDTLQR